MATDLNLKSTIRNLKLSDKKYKNSWVKIILWVMKWEPLRKISDCQLHKSESWPMNLKSLVISWKKSRGNINNLAVMLTRKSLSMKIRLVFYHKSWKDSTVLSKERIMKSEPLEVKSKTLNRTWDSLLLKLPNFLKNFKTTRVSSKQPTNNLKPTGKRSKSLSMKTIHWAMKWEMPKKTWD